MTRENKKRWLSVIEDNVSNTNDFYQIGSTLQENLHPYALSRRVRTILIDSLTLKCPKCKIAIDPLPDACSAVQCISCGVYYCNYCFQYFSSEDSHQNKSECHIHVASHHPDKHPESRDPFLPVDTILQGQTIWKCNQITKCLKLALTSPSFSSDSIAQYSIVLGLLLCFKELDEMNLNICDIWFKVLDQLHVSDANAFPTNHHNQNLPIHMPMVFQGLGYQIMNAIYAQNIPALEQLLSILPQDSPEVDFIDPKSGFCITALAATHGYTQIVRQLLSKGASLTIRHPPSGKINKTKKHKHKHMSTSAHNHIII